MTFKSKSEQMADNVPVTVVRMIPPLVIVNCSRGVKKASVVGAEGDKEKGSERASPSVIVINGNRLFLRYCLCCGK